MVRVKICGITSRKDAWAAVDAGADALGFVLFRGSPRAVAPADARAIVRTLPPLVVPVGVVVDQTAEQVRKTAVACGFGMMQLHGNETPSLAARPLWPRALRPGTGIIKAFRVRSRADLARARSYRVSMYLFDSYDGARHGGTGRAFDWSFLRGLSLPAPFLLSGGLDPENVRTAVRVAKPFGVDVSSGVEIRPGVKDLRRMRSFVRAAKGL